MDTYKRSSLYVRKILNSFSLGVKSRAFAASNCDANLISLNGLTEPERRSYMAEQQAQEMFIDARRAQQPEYFLEALQAAADGLGLRVVEDSPEPGEDAPEDSSAAAALTYLPPNATRYVMPQFHTQLCGLPDRFEFARCRRVQRFPGMRNCCKKVPLARLLHSLQVMTPAAESNFVPATYCMPQQQQALAEAVGWHIVKPNSGTRGEGITICEGGAAAVECCGAEEYVVQRYLEPLLWQPSGRKWDLRLYVLVTAVVPSVEAWLFHTGIARLCSVPYENPTRCVYSMTG